MKNIFCVTTALAFVAFSSAAAQAAWCNSPNKFITLTTTGGSTWTVPSDWNNSNNKVGLVGAGSAFSSGVGAGGGGGAWAESANRTLTSGASIPYAIGAQNSGTDTSFNSGNILANAGAANSVTGGVAVSSVGTTVFNGGSGSNSTGGGGGGGGGPNGDGGTASGTTGGNGDAGFGGAGGAGAAGSDGTELNGTTVGIGGGGGGANGGTAAGAYGAGGGGNSVTGASGLGTQGLIVICYAASNAFMISPPMVP